MTFDHAKIADEYEQHANLLREDGLEELADELMEVARVLREYHMARQTNCMRQFGDDPQGSAWKDT